MPRVVEPPFRLYRFFPAGFPTCHAQCSRNYWLILWDVGEDLETRYKLGLN